MCIDYFNSIAALSDRFRSIQLVVGGVKSTVLSTGKGAIDLQFEVPRRSLVTAVRKEIFDDLLIGNFMKTTIVGAKNLYYPDFALSVAKYADNGGVKISNQLKDYFAYYRRERTFMDRLEKRIRSTKHYLASRFSYEIIVGFKNLIRR